MGDRMNHLALVGLVYKKAPGSTMQLAKVFAFTILPLVILGPVAGVFIDRWNKKKTMIICDILRGLLVLLIPVFLIYAKAIMPVYIVVFLVFALGCFFIPSRLSMLPDIVSSEKLLLANSLSATAAVVSVFIGIAIGGLVVEYFGVRSAFYIDAATYLVSAIMVALMVIKKKIPTKELSPKEIIRKSYLSDLKEGLKFLFTHKDARFVAATLSLLMAGAGSIYVIIIVFIQEEMGSVTRDISLLGLFLGIGFLIGSMIYGRYGQKISRNKAIFSSLAATGLMVGAFALLVRIFANFYVASMIITIVGIFCAPSIVSGNTLIHEVTHEQMRGRIFTSLGVVMSAALLLFMFITSALAEYIDKMYILFFVGITFMICGISGVMITRNKKAS